MAFIETTYESELMFSQAKGNSFLEGKYAILLGIHQVAQK